eukprot:CAMPEP_0171093980 /NCGR_PEP_ID=MMETSP0766_2-20121228/39431_1 /TAXON_ID=439317 /ORGANISM="Gambierdiscus australes, Strain CAWD 149" /LENGTH=177 /DNA_ID=CAMNT_0011552499 /DNA_START=98 /DNA_END=631 /DNA_ORIENTATION=+
MEISSDFGYVMVSAALIALETIGMGASVMGLRQKFFMSDAFKKKLTESGLLEEHKKAFPKQPGGPLLGYPDMGSGRYAALLPYAEWVEFNNAQRSHQNMLEQAPSALVLLILGGLQMPKVSATLGLGYFLGRILYALGYRGERGAKGREVGAISALLCVLGLFGCTVYSGLKLAKFL